MKIFSSLALLFLIFSPTALCNDVHKIGVGINYHLDQKSTPGYQLNYQWQFAESFEFDTRYVDSNDIEVNQDGMDVFGDYSQFSLGANFIKNYNNSLSLKAGTGFTIITASSNESLIKKQAMTPYLSLAANYKINEHLALEIGQSSQFNSEALGTNHSIYILISALFGETSSNTYPTTIATKEPIQANELVEETVQPNKIEETLIQETTVDTPSDKELKEPTSHSAPTKQLNIWYVQFGAYGNEVNARTFVSKVKQDLPTLKLTLLFHDDFYRAVSNPFDSKQRAEDFAAMIRSNHGLSSYVINKKD